MTFEETLDVLHGWLGRRVSVLLATLNHPQRPIVSLRGTLTRGSADHEGRLRSVFSEGSVIFAVTSGEAVIGVLALDRAQFDHGHLKENGAVQVHTGIDDDDDFLVITISPQD